MVSGKNKNLFTKKVYRAVLSIPFGQTRSYKWVAKKAGSARASRAVGTVLKNNPLPFIIPCHRVVKSDKSSGGYVFGARLKRYLLTLEKEFCGCLAEKR